MTTEATTAGIYALAGASIAAIFAFIASMYATYVSHQNVKLSAFVEHELQLAKFRQDWINSLREAMAEMQSWGITPENDHDKQREFYKWGTKIELLMSPGDKDYDELENYLYEFLAAAETGDKFEVNGPYVDVCQRILKREWEKTKSDLEQLRNQWTSASSTQKERVLDSLARKLSRRP